MTNGKPESPKGRRMPVLFIGHGTPMNAIEDNDWSRAFRATAALLPPPTAILCISAHWYVPGLFVTGSARPETIHDFGGFTDALYRVRYPAPGDPALAERVTGLLGSDLASVSHDRGLDHGAWSVLVHMFPDADIPVVQLSIDHRMPPGRHLAIGRMLAPLRDEGVLLMGSGNITHNLGHALGSVRRGETETPGWAASFDAETADALSRHDDDSLVHALESDAGRLNHPTPDHYIPLLHVAGASDSRDAASFPVAGFDLSSLSMRAVLFG